jgi:uncharacterized protein YpbB
MKQGEALEKIVMASGIPVLAISEKTGIGRTTIYRMFHADVVPFHKAYKILAVCGLDIKEVAYVPTLKAAMENDGVVSLDMEEELRYKDKYVVLLEKQLELERENTELKHKLDDLKRAQNVPKEGN